MTTTNEKLVHVNAYTRKDGTHVKEHYRGIASVGATLQPEQNDENMWKTTTIPEEQQSPLQEALGKIFKLDSGGMYFNPSSNVVLEGGVSTADFDFSNVLSALGSVAGIAATVGLSALKAASVINYASKSSDKAVIDKFKPQLYNAVNQIKEAQKFSETAEKCRLKNL